MRVEAESDRTLLVKTPALRRDCPNGSTRAAGDVSVRKCAHAEKCNLCG